MLRWNNDYNHGAHPAILEALAQTNETSYGGYGLDEWCEKAAAQIKARLGGTKADVHFLLGGTQANFTVIAAALRPFQGAVCADTGHINAHETGAVEHGGHKIHPLPHQNGKLTAAQVRAEGERFRTSDIQEHITQPKLVYISCPTELGTLYTKAELEALRAACDEYGMYLYLDGARLGYALGSPACDFTLADLARLTDVFYIGGTKCGALFGEAVVLLNDELKPMFRSYIKQNGGMLAKGWLLGLQFSVLFENDLYFKITKGAVAQAMRIKAAFQEADVPLWVDSLTNQQFAVLTQEQADALARNHIYELQERLPDGRLCLRFCAGWSTRDEDVDALVRDIRNL